MTICTGSKKTLTTGATSATKEGDLKEKKQTMSTMTPAVAVPAIIPPIVFTEIMTVDDVASLLKMSRRQVYELTRTRGQVRQDHPIPPLRINGNLRFRRSDIEAWLEKLACGRTA